MHAGAELRNWLLFYSLPTLHGILPKEYFDHLALLVSAIFLFSSQQISLADLDIGKGLLQQFYKDFADLYGELRYNVFAMNLQNICFAL